MTSSEFKKIERTREQLLALNERNRRITFGKLYPHRAHEAPPNEVRGLHPKDKV